MYWFQPNGGVRPVPAREPPDLHLGGRGRRPGLRLPGHRRPGRRRQGRLLPQAARRAPRRPSTARSTRTRSQAMADHMPARIPDLPGTFLKAATCMYSNTPDEHFVIARHPAHPESVTVACGFSGHGFKFVPVVGEILADLALDRHHRAPDRPVRPPPPRRRARLRSTHVTTTPVSPAPVSAPGSAAAEPDRHPARALLHRPGDLPAGAGAALRVDVVLRGPQRRPGQAGRVPHGPGRPRERPDHPVPHRRAARLPQRLPAPRGPAVHWRRPARSGATSSARTTPGRTTSTAS